MKSILISGLGGSLFPYLHQQLEEDYKLYYVDADRSLTDLYPTLNFIPAPFVRDENYVPFIIELIQNHSIDVYIPLIDEEIEKANIVKEYIPELILISPTPEFSELALNKYRLMKYLSQNDISTIQTWTGLEINESTKYPIFVKPIYGRGSRGIRKIFSTEEFQAYLTLEKYALKDILVQELVEGQEYTIGVITSNKNDILSISSKKVILKKGITIHAVTENNQVIEEIVYRINDRLRPCGPYNVQLFIDENNQARVFEINPRFSTTSIMSYAGGVNEIDLYLKYYNYSFKEKIIRPKTNLFLRRSWQNNFYA